MTVVNAMRFANGGAMVADEQEVYATRKAYTGQKITQIGGWIIGISGTSVILKELLDMLSENADKAQPDRLFEWLNEQVPRVINNKRREVLAKNFGVTLEEFLTGKETCATQGGGHEHIPFDYGIFSKMVQAIEQFNLWNSIALLMGRIESGRFEIYVMDSNYYARRRIPQVYYSIGIGADISDAVLAEYVDNLTPDQRERISPEDGLVKLIGAVNASAARNVGVGGNLQIVYVDKEGKLYQPKQMECHLTSELVKGLKWGYLDYDFVRREVRDLVIKGKKFDSVEPEMRRQLGSKWDEFDLRLRGYRVG
ncbi:hypothetical protein DRJ48_01375 [Candidatus Woesearchaeota archaeon]|nr:hypothetical protein [Candidatus Woesearchaeota archaeon]RLE43260.1 MAG: hypothetical protein DRJ48_01375 [Candidatus Woesearchaeota archaeon]